MQHSSSPAAGSSAAIACRGLLALAVAMGIGRFAFTPILPMMLEDTGLTVTQGGWLASANYLGYLVGALSALAAGLQQRFAIRAGLLTIAVATLATGFTNTFAAWVVLRALPGVASAWVLVHVSAWSLDALGRARRPDLSGLVYAGVGSGIIFAGLACLALAQARLSSADAWIALGIAAVLCTAGLWGRTGSEAGGATETPGARSSPREVPEFWRLIFCQGAFGLGYIVPATFLPVMAKHIVSDPLWFGWAWPVFGAAAVASTLLAASATRFMTHRTLWGVGNLVMAAGVLVPIAVPGLTGIVIAALCVGGTFMVNTMAGMQEAKRVAGAYARVLMAAMTSAFAAGQIAGPLLVSALTGVEGGFTAALVAAAAPLFIASCLLFMSRSSASQEPVTTARREL